ncbi:hypothetical protein HY628_02635 [Candidatus Uhrbacteria bacterium]|nr:hypothetical protein [Candidatus Uhrbacteria bacterium]
MKLLSGVTMFGSAIFVPVMVLGFLAIQAPTGIFYSPDIHFLIHGMIFLSAVLFVYFSLQGFRQTGSLRLLIISAGILLSALLLLVHSLSRFWDGGRSGWYVWLGIVSAAFFLFLAVGLEERLVEARHRRWFLFGFFCFITLALFFSFILIERAMSSNILVEATLNRWTPLGRFLQITSNVLLATASIRYLHGAFIIRSEISLLFATGIVLLTMSTLTLGQSYDEFDISFWIAHVWALFGYVVFGLGVYAASRSFQHGGIYAEITTEK